MKRPLLLPLLTTPFFRLLSPLSLSLSKYDPKEARAPRDPHHQLRRVALRHVFQFVSLVGQDLPELNRN